MPEETQVTVPIDTEPMPEEVYRWQQEEARRQAERQRQEEYARLYAPAAGASPAVPTAFIPGVSNPDAGITTAPKVQVGEKVVLTSDWEKMTETQQRDFARSAGVDVDSYASATGQVSFTKSQLLKLKETNPTAYAQVMSGDITGAWKKSAPDLAKAMYVVSPFAPLNKATGRRTGGHEVLDLADVQALMKDQLPAGAKVVDYNPATGQIKYVLASEPAKWTWSVPTEGPATGKVTFDQWVDQQVATNKNWQKQGITADYINSLDTQSLKEMKATYEMETGQGQWSGAFGKLGKWSVDKPYALMGAAVLPALVATAPSWVGPVGLGALKVTLATGAATGVASVAGTTIWGALTPQSHFGPPTLMQSKGGFLGAWGRGAENIEKHVLEPMGRVPVVGGVLQGTTEYFLPATLVSKLYPSKGAWSFTQMVPHFGPTLGTTVMTWNERSWLSRFGGIGAAVIPYVAKPAVGLLGKVSGPVSRVPVLGPVAVGVGREVGGVLQFAGNVAGKVKLESWAPWRGAYGSSAVSGFLSRQVAKIPSISTNVDILGRVKTIDSVAREYRLSELDIKNIYEKYQKSHGEEIPNAQQFEWAVKYEVRTGPGIAGDVDLGPGFAYRTWGGVIGQYTNKMFPAPVKYAEVLSPPALVRPMDLFSAAESGTLLPRLTFEAPIGATAQAWPSFLGTIKAGAPSVLAATLATLPAAMGVIAPAYALSQEIQLTRQIAQQMLQQGQITPQQYTQIDTQLRGSSTTTSQRQATRAQLPALVQAQQKLDVHQVVQNTLTQEQLRIFERIQQETTSTRPTTTINQPINWPVLYPTIVETPVTQTTEEGAGESPPVGPIPFGLPGYPGGLFGGGFFGFPRISKGKGGFWQTVGYDVFGPDPMTGEVVGGRVGKKRVRYGMSVKDRVAPRFVRGKAGSV